ncbi:MAG: hypothetical protein ACRDBQ_05870 [Shewanella sp.]
MVGSVQHPHQAPAIAVYHSCQLPHWFLAALPHQLIVVGCAIVVTKQGTCIIKWLSAEVALAFRLEHAATDRCTDVVYPAFDAALNLAICDVDDICHWLTPPWLPVHCISIGRLGLRWYVNNSNSYHMACQHIQY